MNESKIPAWRLALARAFLPRSARLTATTVRPSAQEPIVLPDMQLSTGADRYMRAVYGNTPQQRVAQYDLYQELDTYPEVSAILDSYAEEASQVDMERGRAVWVESANEGVVSCVEDMLLRVEAEEMVYAILRDVAKLGDFYHKVHATAGKGVDAVEAVDPGYVERSESDNGTLLGYYYDRTQRGKAWSQDDLKDAYKPWDFIHYRLLGTNLTYFTGTGSTAIIERAVHGKSILATTRVPAKQFKCALDTVMAYRMTNSLDRRNIKVDVGSGSAEQEIFNKLNRWKNQMKRQSYRNPATGEYDVLYNPLGLTDDLIWPTWKDSQTAIEVVPGKPDIWAAYDVDMTLDRLFASANAKKSWYGYGEEADGNRALGFRSIRFARLAIRLQRAVITGLMRLAQIHLALLGLPTSARSFKICMVPPSPLELLQRLEVLQTVLDVGDRMTAFGVNLGFDMEEWRAYILRSLLSFSDSDIDRYCAPIQPGTVGGAVGGMPPGLGAGVPLGPPPGATSPLEGEPPTLPQPEPEAPPLPEPQVASVQRRSLRNEIPLVEGDDVRDNLLNGLMRSFKGGGKSLRRSTVEISDHLDRLPPKGAVIGAVPVKSDLNG